MATLSSLRPRALLSGRPLVRAVRAGEQAGRSAGRVVTAPAKNVGRALADPAASAFLAVLDEAISVLDAGLRSSLAEEALGRILASPLADDVVDRVIVRVLASPETERLIGRVIAGQETERLVGQAVASPETERLIGQALASQEAARLVDQVMDSAIIDAVILKLLEKDSLWVLVDVIAASPAVTAAISQQGVGFVNQMAGVMRERSRTGDDRIEGFARRLIHRPPRRAAPVDDGSETGP